jgi:histidinol-phosphatase (PHP family)
MFYDMHVHSTFSADGESSLGDYAAAFGGGKPGAIGFSEHMDFLPECGSYGYTDPLEYISSIRSLRERGCDFYAGAEIDYVKRVEDDIFRHIKEYNYDFTICSIHMVDGVSVSDRDFPPAGADIGYLLGVVENYYSQLERGISTGAFDVVGHIGVYMRYLPIDIVSDRRFKRTVREAELEIARLCAAGGMIVELNTSGLFSPYACTLPGNEFLKHYYDFGGRLVCLGSDAHRTADVARGFTEGAGILRTAGFRYLTLPWDRERRIVID